MRFIIGVAALSLLTFAAQGADQTLIVVEDHGGTSALPYYQDLDLQASKPSADNPQSSIQIPSLPNDRFGEADMLPVRSPLLTPGTIERHEIQAPGLRPLFLVGDDERSRAWLRQRFYVLSQIHAVGLVVNVDSPEALQTLRGLAPGLTLSPVAADDLGRRLNIHHYPVLITATGIEQ